MCKKVFVILVLCGCYGLGYADTDVRLYRPFESVISYQKVKGICWVQSVNDRRQDAWRCMVGDTVYDPCFVKTYTEQHIVVCPTTPWSEQGIMIELSESLDNTQNEILDMSQGYPWAVQLSNGVRCKVNANNKPVHYDCSGNGILTGYIQRCKSTWKVFYQPYVNGEKQLVDIAIAWF